MEEFPRIKRLHPYILAVVTDLKAKMRKAGEDIIDLGMGNPDLPTPKHIVDKLIEASRNPRNHRYSASRGIPKLRLAICNWYKRKYHVELDPDTEAIATIGAKEGLSHLILAIMGPGDIALVPNPTYPIHAYSVVIANSDVRSISLTSGEGDFLDRTRRAMKTIWPKPKVLIISFPHNPTTEVVDLEFLRRIIEFAKENELLVVHDLAYADLVSDGYSMPGWRVGFVVGNKRMVGALGRIKSYLDYGMFQAIQIAATVALNGPYRVVEEAVEVYRKRRDCLVDGFARIGWEFPKPQGTMFVWAPIPEPFRTMGSVEFSKLLLTNGKVAVSPGVGFGEHGEGFVRFALVENEHRIRQAIRGAKAVLQAPVKARAR